MKLIDRMYRRTLDENAAAGSVSSGDIARRIQMEESKRRRKKNKSAYTRNSGKRHKHGVDGTPDLSCAMESSGADAGWFVYNPETMIVNDGPFGDENEAVDALFFDGDVVGWGTRDPLHRFNAELDENAAAGSVSSGDIARRHVAESDSIKEHRMRRERTARTKLVREWSQRRKQLGEGRHKDIATYKMELEGLSRPQLIARLKAEGISSKLYFDGPSSNVKAAIAVLVQKETDRVAHRKTNEAALSEDAGHGDYNQLQLAIQHGALRGCSADEAGVMTCEVSAAATVASTIAAIARYFGVDPVVKGGVHFIKNPKGRSSLVIKSAGAKKIMIGMRV